MQTLSIGDLSARTGVPPATIRSWESRYGAPTPRRGPGGHRRYDESDVALVDEVLRQRAAGVGLGAAFDRARAGDTAEPVSLFATVTEAHPEVGVNVLTTSTMLALSRAIEDECCARADRPMLFGCFQHPRFYAPARRRWAELARTASATVAFADFDADRTPADAPVEVALASDAALVREWAVVCQTDDRPACLVGWERTTPAGTPRAARRFEAVWSTDPRVVHRASRACIAMLESARPELAGELLRSLGPPPPPPSADLRRATGLLERTLAYLDADPDGRW